MECLLTSSKREYEAGSLKQESEEGGRDIIAETVSAQPSTYGNFRAVLIFVEIAVHSEHQLESVGSRRAQGLAEPGCLVLLTFS